MIFRESEIHGVWWCISIQLVPVLVNQPASQAANQLSDSQVVAINFILRPCFQDAILIPKHIIVLFLLILLMIVYSSALSCDVC